jgi:hypothetical protein
MIRKRIRTNRGRSKSVEEQQGEAWVDVSNPATSVPQAVTYCGLIGIPVLETDILGRRIRISL